MLFPIQTGRSKRAFTVEPAGGVGGWSVSSSWQALRKRAPAARVSPAILRIIVGGPRSELVGERRTDEVRVERIEPVVLGGGRDGEPAVGGAAAAIGLVDVLVGQVDVELGAEVAAEAGGELVARPLGEVRRHALVGGGGTMAQVAEPGGVGRGEGVLA